MKINKMPLGCYGANCYILTCADTKESIIVDPGGEAQKVIDLIGECNFTPKYIVLTHGHGDHIGGVLDLKDKYNIPVLIHEEDEELIRDSSKNLSEFLPMDNIEFQSDENVKDGDFIRFGNLEAEVIHTPGHSQGCICLKVEKDMITGDTLFRDSIGRTDLYGSSNEIVDSIKNKILKYDDNVILYPGHGENSIIGYERKNNSFLV